MSLTEALEQRRKVLEDKHAASLKSIRLLTLMHKPSFNPKEVLIDTLFLGMNNVKAFEQVTYYLLSILEGENIHTYIKHWPITDKNGSSKYRKELLAYLNTCEQFKEMKMFVLLNTRSPNFIEFMYKWTLHVLKVNHERKICNNNDVIPSRLLKNPKLLKKVNDIERKKIVALQEKFKTSLLDKDVAKQSLEQTEQEGAKLKKKLSTCRKTGKVKVGQDYTEVTNPMEVVTSCSSMYQTIVELTAKEPIRIDLDLLDATRKSVNLDYLIEVNDVKVDVDKIGNVEEVLCKKVEECLQFHKEIKQFEEEVEHIKRNELG